MNKLLTKTLTGITAAALCLSMAVPAVMADDETEEPDITDSETVIIEETDTDEEDAFETADETDETADTEDAGTVDEEDTENIDGEDETDTEAKDENSAEDDSEGAVVAISDETAETEDVEKETEPELSISKTSDKTEYTVGESILYTIELGNTVEGTTATDVILTDILPDGMHIKDVNIEGAEGVITYIDSVEAEETAETEDYAYFSYVTIITDTNDEYSFRNAESSAKYGSERTYISEPFEDEDGNMKYVQSYTVYSNDSDSVAIEAYCDDIDDTIELTVIFSAVEKETLPQTDGSAVSEAKQYLKTMSFSEEGLINQLVSAGFSEEEAAEAVSSLDIDWNEQAVKMAQELLDVMAFSYQGVIDQLTFANFTDEQAVYGADNCGADWFEQAVLKGQDYLNLFDFDSDQLIHQLEYSGFTAEEAEYAADVLFGDGVVTEAETEDTKDGVEIYFESIAYDEPVIVTIEAYADAAGEYTNTASVKSAETDEISDSVTVQVSAAVTATAVVNDNTASSDTGNTVVSDSGDTATGTVETTAPKTGSAFEYGVLTAMALFAGATLAVTAVRRKGKENA